MVNYNPGIMPSQNRIEKRAHFIADTRPASKIQHHVIDGNSQMSPFLDYPIFPYISLDPILTGNNGQRLFEFDGLNLPLRGQRCASPFCWRSRVHWCAAS